MTHRHHIVYSLKNNLEFIKTQQLVFIYRWSSWFCVQYGNQIIWQNYDNTDFVTYFRITLQIWNCSGQCKLLLQSRQHLSLQNVSISFNVLSLLVTYFFCVRTVPMLSTRNLSKSVSVLYHHVFYHSHLNQVIFISQNHFGSVILYLKNSKLLSVRSFLSILNKQSIKLYSSFSHLFNNSFFVLV